MSARRSNLLFHWTGKEIALDPQSLNGKQRQEYVDRLFSILHGGLRLTWCHEMIRTGAGIHGWGPRMACLTETRLSSVGEHARKYGLLGLGFDRELVLRFDGMPVHYVRGRPPESFMQDVTGLSEWIFNLRTKLAESNRQEVEVNADRIYRVMALTKAMTDVRRQVEDFELLDEHEWRIVQTKALLPRLSKVRDSTEADSTLWAVPLSPADVRFLVLPDAETREIAMADARFQDFVARRSSPPVMLTLAEAAEL